MVARNFWEIFRQDQINFRKLFVGNAFVMGTIINWKSLLSKIKFWKSIF